MRSILQAVALAILFTASVATASAQVLPTILKRMDAHSKALVTLKGNIKMAKFESVLKETDLFEGEVNYVPGKGSQRDIALRVDWKKPMVEQLVIAGGIYKIYRPKANRMLQGKIEKVSGSGVAANALGFMTMSKAELSANYDIEYKGEETISGGVGTWHLALKPKKPASYKSADLWVDPNGMPLQAKVIEKNDDTTTVLLFALQKNVTIKMNIFTIDPPKGVEIVTG